MAKTKKTPTDEERLLAQIRTAAKRLDAHPGGRLGWLCDWLMEDPSDWLSSDREGHAYRLLALGYADRLPPSLVGESGIKPLTAGDVDKLHAELRDDLQTLVGDPHPDVYISIPTDGLTLGVKRMTAPGVKPAIFARVFGTKDARTAILRAVAELAADSDRLLACKECGRPFLATRKRLFCSDQKTKCLQTWWDREKVKARKKGATR